MDDEKATFHVRGSAVMPDWRLGREEAFAQPRAVGWTAADAKSISIQSGRNVFYHSRPRLGYVYGARTIDYSTLPYRPFTLALPILFSKPSLIKTWTIKPYSFLEKSRSSFPWLLQLPD
jgi:hypothetical protein